jgi:hypothetical protein
MPTYPYRGDKATPGDFSLNPEGEYEWLWDTWDSWWERDGVVAEPPADFYAFFYPSHIDEENPPEFGECNYFVVAGAGSNATVRFSQSFDVGAEYGGYYTWQTPVTMIVTEGRTLVMPFAEEWRDGVLIEDGAPLLRVEVLSGTLNLDTLELQLEPPGGLMRDSGERVWSDWVEADTVAIQPYRRTSFGWGSLHSTATSGLPSLAILNAMNEASVAGPGIEDDGDGGIFASADAYTPDTVGLHNSFSQYEGFGQLTVWADNDEGTVRRRVNGRTYWWDDYPVRWHDTYPAAASYARPNDADYPPFYERDGGWDIHPTEQWQTVHWSSSVHASATYNGKPSCNYLPGRAALSIFPGALHSWPEGTPEDLGTPTLSFPLPTPVDGHVPPLEWVPYYGSDGVLAGYQTTPIVIESVPPGQNVTVIDHGINYDDFDAVYPGGGSGPFASGPGINITVYATWRFYLNLLPPSVRWQEIVWTLDEEGVGFVSPIVPAGYFLDPNANLDGLPDGIDVNFS